MERLFQVPAGTRMVMLTPTAERALSTLSASEKLRTLLLGNFMDKHYVASAALEWDPMQVKDMHPDEAHTVAYEVTGTLSIQVRASTHEEAVEWATIFCNELKKRIASLSIKELEQCDFEVHSEDIEIVS